MENPAKTISLNLSVILLRHLKPLLDKSRLGK
jgi:hypothetical protein